VSSGLKSALVWSAAQTAIRLVLGFLSIKVTAVFLGAAGIALVGQAGNFISLLQGLLVNAIQTAVVKMTAERKDEHQEQSRQLWGTAIRLSTFLGVIVGVLVMLAHRPLSVWLFGREDLWPVVGLIGVILPIAMLYQVLNGVLTGLSQFRLIAFTNIGTAVLGAVVFIGLSYRFGLLGGLVGSTLSAGIGLIVVLAVARLSRAFQFTNLLPRWQSDLIPSIFAFYPMLLVHAATAPLTQLLVRDALIGSVGVNQAGLWQAGLRLSDMYTQVLLTALSMYSLPTLSGIKEPTRFRRELFGMVVKMGAITASLALAIFVCRDLILQVVFTTEFLPVRELMGFQLVGDVLNMAAWPMRSALMAQGRRKTYMSVEASAGIAQVGLTHLLLPALGLQAATTAHAGTWGMVLVVLLLLHRKGRQLSPGTDSAVDKQDST